jgi:hypothetical protein
MNQTLTQLKPTPLVSLDPSAADTTKTQHWEAVFAKTACSLTQLIEEDVPPRESVIGNWFLQGDLGFVYGPRGLGKTWLAMHLAVEIAKGGKVANWQVPKPRRVLYIDGEMPLDALRERAKALSSGENCDILFIQHEVLFHKFNGVLNLADPSIQTAISNHCQNTGVEVLVLDNLSCLFSGIKENDADGWDFVLPWLLDLRRQRIAVVFIAHAGRNGNMRGTSRREDAAFWILQLTRPDDGDDDEDGARFVCAFDKIRNATEAECPTMEWLFRRDANGRTEVTCKAVTNLEKFRYWIEQGLHSATDIALEMGVTKGCVSKWGKKGQAQGWMKIVNGLYHLVAPKQPTTMSAADAHEIIHGRGGL